jgi:hypothetical protein
MQFNTAGDPFIEDPEFDFGGLEDAWREEIRRRIEQIDSGTVRMVPWDQARRIMRESGRPY